MTMNLIEHTRRFARLADNFRPEAKDPCAFFKEAGLFGAFAAVAAVGVYCFNSDPQSSDYVRTIAITNGLGNSARFFWYKENRADLQVRLEDVRTAHRKADREFEPYKSQDGDFWIIKDPATSELFQKMERFKFFADEAICARDNYFGIQSMTHFLVATFNFLYLLPEMKNSEETRIIAATSTMAVPYAHSLFSHMQNTVLKARQKAFKAACSLESQIEEFNSPKI